MAAESSANASAPHSTMTPPSTQTPSMKTGSGTRVAMPAGVRKMPPPIVMPITRPIELRRPSRRTRVAAMVVGVYVSAKGSDRAPATRTLRGGVETNPLWFVRPFVR
jgi:hypothetical protein